MRQPTDGDIAVLHRILSKRCCASLDDAQNIIAGWLIFDIKEAGFFMVKGNEVHTCIDPEVESATIPRSVIRSVFRHVMTSHDCIVTSVMNDNKAGIAFVKRLGFFPVEAGPVSTKYMMRDCRYAH